MTYEELLRSVTQALPETEGKIALERVRFSKKENKAYFSFLSDVLIGEKGFFIMKNALGKAFPGLKFSNTTSFKGRSVKNFEQPEREIPMIADNAILNIFFIFICN